MVLVVVVVQTHLFERLKLSMSLLIVSSTRADRRAPYGGVLPERGAWPPWRAAERAARPIRRPKSGGRPKMNGQRRHRYFAAGRSFTIAASRRGDWVVIRTAAHYFESKRVSAESSAKCGRLFWPLGWFSR